MFHTDKKDLPNEQQVLVNPSTTQPAIPPQCQPKSRSVTPHHDEHGHTEAIQMDEIAYDLQCHELAKLYLQ